MIFPGSDGRYLLTGGLKVVVRCICIESNKMRNKLTEATNATI